MFYTVHMYSFVLNWNVYMYAMYVGWDIMQMSLSIYQRCQTINKVDLTHVRTALVWWGQIVLLISGICKSFSCV